MDKERIFNDLIEKYKQKHKKSEALFEKICRHQSIENGVIIGHVGLLESVKMACCHKT